MTNQRPPDPSDIRHPDELAQFLDACEVERIDGRDDRFRLDLTGPGGRYYELEGKIGRMRSEHGTHICLYDQDAGETVYYE